jgi:probable HAF family extracellular repeat protein
MRALKSVFLFTAFTATMCAGTKYIITDLGTLGGDRSDAYYINDSGRVLGKSRLSSGDDEWFLYFNGSLTPWPYGTPTAMNSSGQVIGSYLPYPGSIPQPYVYSGGSLINLTFTPQAINDAGQVVGFGLVRDTGVLQAYLYSGSSTIPLPMPAGAVDSVALNINNAGQVVGAYTTVLGGDYRAFLYSDGVVTDLGTPIRSASSAASINKSGQTVGTMRPTGKDYTYDHAFLYSGSIMTDLQVAGWESTSAYGINDSGQIVGAGHATSNPYLGDLDADHNAVLFSGGSIIDLQAASVNAEGWHLIWAYAVNNNGQIVGTGQFRGWTRGFLLTPVSDTTNTTLHLRRRQ